MTGHHPLCPMGQDLAHRPRLDLDEMQPCQCPIIHAVTALVGDDIAAAIDQYANAVLIHNNPDTDRFDAGALGAFRIAARIARGGDTDA